MTLPAEEHPSLTPQMIVDRRAEKFRRASSFVWASAIFGPLLGELLSQMLSAGWHIDLGPAPAQWGVVYLLLAIAVGLYLRAEGASAVPLDRRPILVRIAMTLAVLLAPLAVVLTVRLSFEMCLVVNFLGLPWPEWVKLIVRIASAIVILGAGAAVSEGLRSTTYRPAARVLQLYLAIVALPTVFTLFFSVYGDPGLNCIPV